MGQDKMGPDRLPMDTPAATQTMDIARVGIHGHTLLIKLCLFVNSIHWRVFPWVLTAAKVLKFLLVESNFYNLMFFYIFKYCLNKLYFTGVSFPYHKTSSKTIIHPHGFRNNKN